MPTRTLLLLLCATFASCTNDDGAGDAARAFATFQDALHRRDESACRESLTTESARVLAAMPWHRLDGKQPLEVLSAEREQNEFRVQVSDPNEGGRRSEFVVVREYGKLVVDLVATAGLCAEVVEATAPRESFEPRELTPADFDRIRQPELSQPRR
jgi:hypothetical protein